MYSPFNVPLRPAKTIIPLAIAPMTAGMPTSSVTNWMTSPRLHLSAPGLDLSPAWTSEPCASQ